MAKTLTGRVSVAGVWYERGAQVGRDIPEDVAAKITNPKVWSYTDADENDQPEAVRTTGARLSGRVSVAGVWYGPDSDVPEDVARKISNPKAWEGGRVPTFDEPKEQAEKPAGDGPQTGLDEQTVESTADEPDEKPADGGEAAAQEEKPTAPRRRGRSA